MEQGTIVEINGVKMEVDFRSAKATRVDTFKVGTKVKLLKKTYSGHEVKTGVIVGFDAFEKLPTITVAVIETGYGANPVSFFAFNASEKECELLASDDGEETLYRREEVVATLARNIESKKLELANAEGAYALFIKYFGAAVQEPVKA